MVKKKKVAGGIVVALIVIIAVVAIVWLVMDDSVIEPTYTCADNGGTCRTMITTSVPNVGDCNVGEALSSLTCPSGQTCCVQKTCEEAGGTCRETITTAVPHVKDCNTGETMDSTLACDSGQTCCIVSVETNACTDSGYLCVDTETSCSAGLGGVIVPGLAGTCGGSRVCCNPVAA